mgnify:CR=1 FL=1
MTNIIKLIHENKATIELHTGHTFNTDAEHKAFVAGVKHAVNSLGLMADNIVNNAEIKQ